MGSNLENSIVYLLENHFSEIVIAIAIICVLVKIGRKQRAIFFAVCGASMLVVAGGLLINFTKIVDFSKVETSDDASGVLKFLLILIVFCIVGLFLIIRFLKVLFGDKLHLKSKNRFQSSEQFQDEHRLRY